MVVIGLLLAAAVCLVLGFVMASVPLLIASLAVTLVAGIVVARSYVTGRQRRRAATEEEAADRPAEATSSAPVSAPARQVSSAGTSAAFAAPQERRSAVATAERAVLVVDGRPDYHGSGCADLDGRSAVEIPYDQAVGDGFTPCPVCHGAPVAPPEKPTQSASESGDPMVLVVDGYPDYHVEGCTRLDGQDTVAIPHGQAVEDGFAPCGTCAPETASAQVWVADGFPDYHRENCADLAGHDSVAIPRDQAVEDGFTACRDCAPDSAAGAPASSTPDSAPDSASAAASAAAASGPAAEVWVVDGFPNYHRSDCVELVGQAAEAIPHDQAVEDGFGECAICTPEAAGAPAAPAESAPQGSQGSQASGSAQSAPAAAGSAVREVFVADGYPDFHLAGCPAAAGLATLVPLPIDDAVEFGFAECSVCRPKAGDTLPPEAAKPVSGDDAVLVVDGFPNYHRSGCSELSGLHEEPVPHDQAVEDGFRPCPVCRPDSGSESGADSGPQEPPAAQAAAAAETTTAQAPQQPVAAATSSDGRETVRLPAGGLQASPPSEVLVVDGYPAFHVAGCSELTGLDEEPIPYAQAVEDGFQPCPVCRPDGAAASGAGGAGASAGAGRQAPSEVLVVDGYPDYHLAGCAQVAGLEAEPIFYAQAVEDGFAPCSVCTPDGSATAPEAQSVPGAQTAAAEPEQQAEPEQRAEPQQQPEPAQQAEPEQAAEPEQRPEPAHGSDGDEHAGHTLDEQPAAPASPSVDSEPAPLAAAAVGAEPASGDAPATSAETPVTDGSGAAGQDAGTVWVVDGRPRFHAEDCLIIKGQSAQPVDRAQAEQDGFRPCSLCQRPAA